MSEGACWLSSSTEMVAPPTGLPSQLDRTSPESGARQVSTPAPTSVEPAPHASVTVNGTETGAVAETCSTTSTMGAPLLDVSVVGTGAGLDWPGSRIRAFAALRIATILSGGAPPATTTWTRPSPLSVTEGVIDGRDAQPACANAVASPGDQMA